MTKVEPNAGGVLSETICRAGSTRLSANARSHVTITGAGVGSPRSAASCEAISSAQRKLCVHSFPVANFTTASIAPPSVFSQVRRRGDVRPAVMIRLNRMAWTRSTWINRRPCCQTGFPIPVGAYGKA